MITFGAWTVAVLLLLAAPRARSQSASEGLNGLGLLKFAPPESKVGGQLIGRSTPTRFLDQAAPSNWQDPQFDDSSWRAVTLPCGYDRGSAALTALLATNVPQMLGQGRDVFHRHRFVPSNAQFALIGVYGARLRIAADNAASAWLNNQQVIVGQSDSNYRYWSYDVPLAASLFRSRPGDANVFAFQVLNTVNSSDQFFDFELVVDTSLVSVIEPAVGPGTNMASGWFADDNVQANDNSWFTSPTFQFNRPVAVNLPIGFSGPGVVESSFNPALLPVTVVFARKVISVSAARLALFSAVTARMMFSDRADVYVGGSMITQANPTVTEAARYFNREAPVTITAGQVVIAANIFRNTTSPNGMFFSIIIEGTPIFPTTTAPAGTTPAATPPTTTSTSTTTTTTATRPTTTTTTTRTTTTSTTPRPSTTSTTSSTTPVTTTTSSAPTTTTTTTTASTTTTTFTTSTVDAGTTTTSSQPVQPTFADGGSTIVASSNNAGNGSPASTANGNDIGSNGDRSAGEQGPDGEMDWLPFFIGGGVCLFCLCIVCIALIVRYRNRRDRGERLQETGLHGTNMYDMDVGDNNRESVKVDYLEPESTHELLPPLEMDMAPADEPITEVHIEWVESERESERLPGYSALPAAASMRNGAL